MALAPGTRLASYEVIAQIGVGGMGEVYRARDIRLGRDVAIKILPGQWLLDPDRSARFEREARLLASLNHPHIAAIYGFEESAAGPGQNSVRALVLELVEGATLADRIGGSPLPVRSAVAIAQQIADALDAAHERGIVHRDLKPANIKVTDAGVVKLLDFGLAKAMAGDQAAPDLSLSPTVTIGGTRDGVLLGTAAYMSPEQARGGAVDKRTDIWAFGCVLYEMLAGRQAFSGDTLSHTIVAILERDPDWTRLPPSTPDSLRRLLARCLDKDPRRRLRDIGDARLDLDDALSGSARTASTAPRSGVRMALALAALLAVLSSAALFVLRRSPGTEAPPRYSVEALTNDPGFTGQPTLSRDGRLLAYASDRSGRGDLDIWVQQTAGGVPLRVTDDEADDQAPDFSPDGSQLAFRSERDGGGVYVAPALGGAARLIAREGRNPRFSPDGSRIAYWVGAFRGELAARPSAIYVVSLTGGAPTRVMADFAVASNPVWSPDGRALLVSAVRDRKRAAEFDWWLAPVDGGTPMQTGIMDWEDLRAKSNLQNTVWTGSWTASGLMMAKGAQILRLPLSLTTGRLTGEPAQLISGIGTYGPPAAGSGGELVVSSYSQIRTIERLPIGEKAEPPTQLFQDSNNVGWRASVSRDGLLVVFEREIGGRREIWSKNVTSGEEHLIVPVPTKALVNATVSPDGSRLTYVIPDSGTPDFGKGFVVEVGSGVPRSVCERCSMWGFLPDSRRAVVTDRKSIQFMDDRGTAQTVIVTPDVIDRPFVAPDGHAIAFRIQRESNGKTFVAPLSSSASVPPSLWTQVDEPTTSGRPCGWSPDSSTLYLLLDADGFRDLWAQKVDRSGRVVGAPFVVRHLHHMTGVSTSYGNAITAQGFLYESTRLTGNLWQFIPQSPK